MIELEDLLSLHTNSSTWNELETVFAMKSFLTGYVSLFLRWQTFRPPRNLSIDR